MADGKSIVKMNKMIHKKALPLTTDSVDIIFQDRLRMDSFYFLNKKGLTITP